MKLLLLLKYRKTASIMRNEITGSIYLGGISHGVMFYYDDLEWSLWYGSG